MGYDDDPLKEIFHNNFELGIWDNEPRYSIVPHPPPDHILIKSFESGRTKGRYRTKYGHTQSPSSNNPWIYDAWIAGYNFGFGEGNEPNNS
jgi:hypothetical protein